MITYLEDIEEHGYLHQRLNAVNVVIGTELRYGTLQVNTKEQSIAAIINSITTRSVKHPT